MNSSESKVRSVVAPVTLTRCAMALAAALPASIQPVIMTTSSGDSSVGNSVYEE